MFCTSCGTQLNEGNAFCIKCGEKSVLTSNAGGLPQGIPPPQQQPVYNQQPNYSQNNSVQDEKPDALTIISFISFGIGIIGFVIFEITLRGM